MNTLVIAVFASMVALATAAPSHGVGGAVVAGPAGVVTSHGAIGPAGHGHGHGHIGAVVAGPLLGHGVLGIGGLGHGLGLGHHGGVVVTHGGGVVGLGGHGVAVHGPHAAPAVISGPSGHIAADGVWGPTAHWGHGVHGHGHGW